MHLAIDASNIRQGGGITHLSQLLDAADPAAAGITHISVWACRATLAQLPNQPWLTKVSPAWTEARLFVRMLGQQFLLAGEIAQRGCEVLFSPGGTVPWGVKIPVVTMSQNLLPFAPQEALHFGRWSWMRCKMWLLRHAQGRSFRAADGVIFLTHAAQKTIARYVPGLKEKSVVVAHGIEPRFSLRPRVQQAVSAFSLRQPLTVLYVSILMPYKHQIEVAHAIHALRQQGYPIRGKFLGSDWGAYGTAFRNTLHSLNPAGDYLVWPGSVPYTQLHQEYGDADVFVFASGCENLPNILIEAMAAGLPIACAERGPMQEVLGDAGIYFDPQRPNSIAQALRLLLDDAALRERLATRAWQSSKEYTWQRCARETLAFIASVAAQRVGRQHQDNNDHV